jgi:outer membrane biogenesis lipoprotein LolB
MKEYILSFADSITHQPEHPERTTRQNCGWDVKFRVWNSRTVMARAIRMQEKREHYTTDFKAVIPLKETEGY